VTVTSNKSDFAQLKHRFSNGPSHRVARSSRAGVSGDALPRGREDASRLGSVAMRARVRPWATSSATMRSMADAVAPRIAQDLEATRRSGDDSFGAMGD
jgi:hypothetical protein